MIVYNVARRWFTEKVPAETYRKSRGLSPSHTLKITVDNRVDLAALLNGLCTPVYEAELSFVAPVTSELVEAAYVEPSHNIPDYIPLFLIDKDQRDLVAYDREQRGCIGLEG
jgi:hypothetical protein